MPFPHFHSGQRTHIGTHMGSLSPRPLQAFLYPLLPCRPSSIPSSLAGLPRLSPPPLQAFLGAGTVFDVWLLALTRHPWTLRVAYAAFALQILVFLIKVSTFPTAFE